MQHIQEQYDSLTAAQQRGDGLAGLSRPGLSPLSALRRVFQVEVVEPPRTCPGWNSTNWSISTTAAASLWSPCGCALTPTPVVTVPMPGVPEVTLYAQHQHEVQRLVAAHGMAAVPWPPPAYTGSTAFDLLFPERLALNRDLLFVLYATPRALRRYARVLQQTPQTVSALPTTDLSPSVSTLAASGPLGGRRPPGTPAPAAARVSHCRPRVPAAAHRVPGRSTPSMADRAAPTFPGFCRCLCVFSPTGRDATPSAQHATSRAATAAHGNRTPSHLDTTSSATYQNTTRHTTGLHHNRVMGAHQR